VKGEKIAQKRVEIGRNARNEKGNRLIARRGQAEEKSGVGTKWKFGETKS